MLWTAGWPELRELAFILSVLEAAKATTGHGLMRYVSCKAHPRCQAESGLEMPRKEDRALPRLSWNSKGVLESQLFPRSAYQAP